MKRRFLAVVAASVLLSPATAAAAPLPIGQCTPTSGVILAVDFGHWGGPLVRSCGSTPTTGYQLLHQGGWTTTGTQHDGPGFICRIGYSGFRGATQYPTADEERCVLTPPATAYWSYWHADPGDSSWTYSRLGAVSYKPKAGSVDLWIFGATGEGGAGGRPSFSPESVRAKAPKPSAPPRPKPASSSPRTTPARQSPEPAPSAVVVGSPSVQAGATAGESVAAIAQGPPVLDAEPTLAASTSDPGTPVGALTAVALLVLLAVVGAVIVWRRRTRDDGA